MNDFLRKFGPLQLSIKVLEQSAKLFPDTRILKNII